MAAKKYTSFQLFVRLARQARPYWPHLTVLLFLSILATPVALMLPLPLAMVVDSFSAADPIPGFVKVFQPEGLKPSGVLLFAVAFFIVLSLVDQLQKLAANMLGSYTGERLLLNFRAQIFRHVQRLSLSYHDTQGTADSNYRIHWDAGAIQWVAVFGLPPFFSAALMLVGMIYITAQINWDLALVALGVIPVLYLITFVSSRRLRRGWETAKNLESTAYTVVQEVLTGLRVVKAFGQEEREEERFVKHSGEGTQARIRLTFLDSMFGLLFGVTLAMGTALVLFLGGRQLQNGQIQLGDLVVVMGYLALLYAPVQVISKSFTTMQNSLASAERVFSLLDENPDVIEKPDARRIKRAAGAVAFRGVAFAYEGDQCALRDVSFEVAPGARVGIAGATGAGKTTLVSLLSRFYDPAAGQILLDGVDLRDYKLADLRAQFSVVSQEPVLFSTTIAENIAYARPEATEAEIIAAATAANAHEFISRFPERYQTLVGERGLRLSGGERQRIALARAFLKDAPILVLDEPTSSVDYKTEAGIMEAMDRLMRGRSTLMIAHRLSTLANCDVRLEIEDGRLRTVVSKEPVAAE
jgi:ATP-binding cassette subfamily B protein